MSFDLVTDPSGGKLVRSLYFVSDGAVVFWCSSGSWY